MECALSDLRGFVSILHALQLENRKDYPLEIFIDKQGVGFHSMTQAGDVMIQCVLTPDWFHQFRVDDQIYNSLSQNTVHAACYNFSLVLPHFLHYIQAFGLGASMILKYLPEEKKLQLILTHKDGRSECFIQVHQSQCFSALSDWNHTDCLFEIHSFFFSQPKRLRDSLMDIQDNSELTSKIILQVSPLEQNNGSESRKDTLSEEQSVLTMNVTTQCSSCCIAFPYTPQLFPVFQVKTTHSFSFKVFHVVITSWIITRLPYIKRNTQSPISYGCAEFTHLIGIFR
ncbi:uncharacterized protein LOC128884075 isoform X2 [Hylaeus volcanicus]|uniref:uncharacterized protein LOC128884075 isoform X2 n=1 Tax=Hylaeus volcanicus TaxID=313075 RepID=UPI0023B79550|nr:uncharacterized protein LOC128884075 isoform X2 [Hylaeus volcanicus]XP_053993102.1 uncharacterized protein LOC128884075 isoform X2 [Hylaeus volcanicus]XP_053993103.1 uncharacterized protein LOC128884075 isoform X2 [Hylaeus volcanicus]